MSWVASWTSGRSPSSVWTTSSQTPSPDPKKSSDPLRGGCSDPFFFMISFTVECS